MGPTCQLHGDRSQMLQSGRSQRENKKFSERARSPDASPATGPKRRRKCSQLSLVPLPLQHFLRVLILRSTLSQLWATTACSPTVCREGSAGAAELPGRGVAGLHLARAPYPIADGKVRGSVTDRGPLRSISLNHYCPKQ